MLNLYEKFEYVFKKKPNKISIFSHNKNYTYSDISKNTAKIANYLISIGLKKGERVAVQVTKSPHNLFLYLACLRSGFIYLPLNCDYTDEELNYFFDDAKPSLVICDPAKESSILKLVEKSDCIVKSLDNHGKGSVYEGYIDASDNHPIKRTKANDTAVILYTSGTTGKPKGAMITHKNLFCNASDLNDVWEITEKDTLLHMLPLFHVHGLFFACHTIFLAGASMIFLQKFDVDQFFENISNATVFMGVPTYYTRLLNDKRLSRDIFCHMRLLISGSAPLLAATFNEFKEKTGHSLLERYGMTETGVNTSNPLNGERKIGTVGLPLPSVKVRLVNDANEPINKIGDIGEIQVKGNNLFKGYWKNPQKTAEDFTKDHYFKTGDLGRFDEEGFLSIVGRSKDVIITGGLNVYPKEIELTINAFKGVVESAVIGLPNRDFGETVVAVVAGNAQELDEQIMLAALKKHHAGFKCPKKIFFVKQLPKNTMGKVQKNILRKQFELIFAKE